MRKRRIHGFLLGLFVFQGSVYGQAPRKIDFRRDVLPLFRSKCYDCHGPSLQMSGFRLDRRRDALRGGTIAVIGPGNAEGSRLYWKLVGTRFGTQMPPTGALAAEQIEIIRNWIDQGADWPDDASGETPATRPDPRAVRLMRALRSGDRRSFARLAAKDAKAVNSKGEGGVTPLMYATLYSNLASTSLLLDKGADPNARTDAGATALMWAAGDLEKARLLLARGADVNARSDDGRTPLLIAAGIPGNSAAVKLLIDSGAKLTVKGQSLGGEATPLTAAALAADESTFLLLASRGADLQASGPAALALAMRARCDACVKLLLKGANPDLLSHAMFMVSPPMGPGLGVKALLEAGATIPAKHPSGHSILTLAAASEAFPVETIRALLDRGVEVNEKTSGGETALELARRHGLTPVVELLLKAGAREVAPVDNPWRPKPAASVRQAVERALPLIQRNDETFLRKSGCVSCHNNSLAALTVAAARRRGFRVDEQEVRAHTTRIGTYLETWRERALQNIGIPGDADTIGYILFGLAAAGYPQDAATDAMAVYLKRQQMPDGHWMKLANRPPIESSDIQVTATAMRSLQAYTPAALKTGYQRDITRAAAWLAGAHPESNEDRVFQLLGLRWADGDKQKIHRTAAELLAQQRPDGGWSQIPSLGSDAYATGQALFALQEAGVLRPGNAPAKKAIAFLLNNQAEDGSWYVRHRAIPLQPFFESGFPYGRDQFISAAATNWAATALAQALD